MSNSLQPTRLLCPWGSPGKNTGVSCHFFFQGIFLTQGSNPHLLHCRLTLYPLNHQGSPRHCQKEWVAPQWLGWSSLSLTYEFTRKTYPDHIPWPEPLPSAVAHTLKHGFSLNPNKCASYFLAGLEFRERAEGQEEKAVGKMCQGIPFITCQKLC